MASTNGVAQTSSQMSNAAEEFGTPVGPRGLTSNCALAWGGERKEQAWV